MRWNLRGLFAVEISRLDARSVYCVMSYILTRQSLVPQPGPSVGSEHLKNIVSETAPVVNWPTSPQFDEVAARLGVKVYRPNE